MTLETKGDGNKEGDANSITPEIDKKEMEHLQQEAQIQEEQLELGDREQN